MRSAPHRYLSHVSFAWLLAANILTLTVLIVNQWLAVHQGWVWVLSTGIAMALMPLVLRLADTLFALVRTHRNAPPMGHSFPWSSKQDAFPELPRTSGAFSWRDGKLASPAAAMLMAGLLAACAGGRELTLEQADRYRIVDAPVAPLAGAPAPSAAPVTPEHDGQLANSEAGGTEEAVDSGLAVAATPVDDVRDRAVSTVANTVEDPWEGFNRHMHRFNNALDSAVARPVAVAYQRAVPLPIRHGIGNFFRNLGQPISALNALLQGKPGQAWDSLGRFLINTTVGIGGLLDPASAGDVPFRSADLGQTFGTWGWQQSRYVVLPLFGPSTVRDSIGRAGDEYLGPLRQADSSTTRYSVLAVQLVDTRAQLLSLEGFREGAADDYALIRDAWLQRRNHQIRSQGRNGDDEALPDYLFDIEE